MIGRFIGVDPIAEKFAHVTVYNYAENSPISNIDLWGLQAENFMSKFKKLNDLNVKLPDMSKVQIQVYSTLISNPEVSVDDLKNLFLTSPQEMLSNSKAIFHSPVDGRGKQAKFEKGNFMKIDIKGPMNDSYIKIHDVIEDDSSVGATFVTLEGHVEKGLIKFDLKEEKDGNISFTISSASQVDYVPKSFARKEQAASWNEVLNNIINLAGGKEERRINYVKDPKD